MCGCECVGDVAVVAAAAAAVTRSRTKVTSDTIEITTISVVARVCKRNDFSSTNKRCAPPRVAGPKCLVLQVLAVLLLE